MKTKTLCFCLFSFSARICFSNEEMFMKCLLKKCIFNSADDESGNVKTSLTSKSKIRDDELQVRLGLFLENNHSQGRTKHKQSLSSLGSNNTSPLSTLTNSSEADMSRGSMHEKSQTSKRGCESIGSLLSVSISEHSNASSNSLGRRHSLAGKV